MNEENVQITENKNKSGTVSKRIVILFLICAALLAAAELVFSSRKAIGLALSGAPRTEIPIEEVSSLTGAKRDGDGIKITGACKISFGVDSVPVEYIAVTFTKSKVYSEISVLAKDSAQQKTVRQYQTDYVWLGDGYAVLDYDSAGEATYITLQFSSAAKGTVVTGITLNEAFGIRFNTARWLIAVLALAAVLMIKEFRLYRIVYDSADLNKRLFVVFAAAICLISAFIGNVKGRSSVEYPFTKAVSEYTCYQQQTDALLKGRLDLDIDFDEESLASLDNPYDYSVRRVEASKAHKLLWDKAYNAETGKIYSYFGIAPVLLFYLPFTVITGNMPGDGAASLFFTVVATFSFIAALLAMLGYFKIKTDVVTLSAGIAALCCGSLLYVLNVHPSMYYIAVICGMAFLALVINFALRAAMAEKPLTRRVFLALAGLSVVLTVASRPIALIYAVMLLPAFIKFFFTEKRPLKTKLAESAFLFVPVIAGAAAIMAYNAARFGSPFDFGSTRQLTFYDMGYCGLEIYKIAPSFYHYFLQPLEVIGRFPFLDLTKNDLANYRGFEYIAGSFGAFNFPAALGIFAALPVTRGDRVKRFTYLGAILAAVFVGFADFCLAGSHLRYTGDVMFPLCLIGVLALIEIVSAFEGKPYARHVRAAVWAVMGLTVLISSALLFNNEADNIRVLAPDTYRFFEKLFR